MIALFAIIMMVLVEPTTIIMLFMYTAGILIGFEIFLAGLVVPQDDLVVRVILTLRLRDNRGHLRAGRLLARLNTLGNFGASLFGKSWERPADRARRSAAQIPQACGIWRSR